MINKIQYIIFIFSFILIGFTEGYSQIDSLSIKHQKLDTQLHYFKLKNDKKQIANIKLEIGNLYLNYDSVQMAELYFQEALKINDSLNNPLPLFETNLTIGIRYEGKSHLSLALRYFLAAEKYSINLKPQDRIRILRKIGLLFYDLENYSRAFNYFTSCKIIAQGNNLKEELSSAYINIGEVYRFDGNYEEAYNSYMASLEIEKERNDQMGIATNYNNLALLFLKQKKYDEAHDYFLKSQQIVNKFGNIEKIASIHTGLGHYYFETKNFGKAIESFLKTLDYDLPAQIREDIIYRDAYEGLYRAYNAIGDDKNAFKYYQRYYSLREKISGIKTQDQLMEIEIRFAVEKQIQKTQFYEEIAKIEKLKKKRQATVFIILLVLLFSLVTLLFLTFRLKYKTFKQKKELYEKEKKLNRLEIEKTEAENLRLASINSELEASKIITQLKNNHFKMELAHKKRELASIVLHLSSKNEILTQIKENLIKRKFLRENEPIVSSILAEINSNLNLDRDWNSFKLHFEGIHPKFFNHLTKNYPDITTEELKLCAYLRINLTSKEIAKLLNITTIAVNKRRNRLRKKINIEKTESLYEFISKIQ